MMGLCGRSFICVVLLQALLATLTVSVYGKLNLEEIAKRYTKRTPSGIHLPIVRVENPTKFEKRANISLSDLYDVFYSVLVQIGNTTVPLQLDTGSSDLWVASDACTEGCGDPAKLYPQAGFKSAGIDIQLNYGDSFTGTFASGLIGYDNVSLDGISDSSQAFAAINRTSLQQVEFGIPGILGVGFPINSLVWRLLFANLNKTVASHTLPFIGSPLIESWSKSRQAGISPSTVKAFLDSWNTNISPLIPRLFINMTFQQPLVAITLERVTGGGNPGLLSIGELPSGVKSSDLTWAGLRGYNTSEGGIPGPPDSPSEVYPYMWEVPIDNVYFDGVKLPATNMTPASIGVSGFIDTGNSLIRGPADSLSYINQRLGPNGQFKCAESHVLSFEIGGVIFPVDPRDFMQPVTANSSICTGNLAVTDPPKVGAWLNTWSLGTPFLKGVLSVFYFGNITYPSQDPPKIGFLSTVSGDLLKTASSASMTKTLFPAPIPSTDSVTSTTITQTSVANATPG